MGDTAGMGSWPRCQEIRVTFYSDDDTARRLKETLETCAAAALDPPDVKAAWKLVELGLSSAAAARQTPCNCRVVCGDVQDEIGTCKDLPRAPEAPLIELVTVPRGASPFTMPKMETREVGVDLLGRVKRDPNDERNP